MKLKHANRYWCESWWLPTQRAGDEQLRNAGHELIDFGTRRLHSCDYPDYAKQVGGLCKLVRLRSESLSAVVNVGAAVAANKLQGHSRHSADTLQVSITQHDDCNVLCLGARVKKGYRRDRTCVCGGAVLLVKNDTVEGWLKYRSSEDSSNTD